MVGNHDWYYHLEGSAFDEIRRKIIDSMGLSNSSPASPMNWKNLRPLHEVMGTYKVFVRHGDYYDKFNFNREKGRDHATLGDIFTMDVCNRYPVEVQKRYGDKLSPEIINSLRRITNVRPALATPLWISGQIRRHAGTTALEAELKKVWDDLCDEFLQLDIVREQDKSFKFDIVDAMQLILKISKRTSFSTLNDIVIWVRDRLRESDRSFAEHALREPAFLDNWRASWFMGTPTITRSSRLILMASRRMNKISFISIPGHGAPTTTWPSKTLPSRNSSGIKRLLI